MALDQQELSAVKALDNDISSAFGDLKKLSNYYDAEQRLRNLGIAVPPQLSSLQIVVNWPRLSVDAVEERLDIEGFRVGGSDAADEELWRIWQANNLDVESQLAHTEALMYGRAYVVVGSNEADPSTPIVTVESPTEVTVARDARTRKVSAALRRYGPDLGGQPKFATLMLPDTTVWLERGSGGTWVEQDRDNHGMGEVPVFPLLNRARITDLVGRSDMADVIPLTDSVVRTLTNLEIAKEFHAVPQRYALGVLPSDFTDKDGNPITAWEAYIGHFLALGNEEAKVGQLSASDLRNFTEVVNLYAKLVSSVTGLPPHYLGYSDANPASADAIRSSETRLVKRSERRQRTFGGGWEASQKYILRLLDEDPNRTVETIWRDASTPTFAAKADGAVKLFAAGAVPVEAVWDEMGYSQEKQKRYRELLDNASPAGALARAMSAQDVIAGAE